MTPQPQDIHVHIVVLTWYLCGCTHLFILRSRLFIYLKQQTLELSWKFSTVQLGCTAKRTTRCGRRWALSIATARQNLKQSIASDMESLPPPSGGFPEHILAKADALIARSTASSKSTGNGNGNGNENRDDEAGVAGDRNLQSSTPQVRQPSAASSSAEFSTVSPTLAGQSSPNSASGTLSTSANVSSRRAGTGTDSSALESEAFLATLQRRLESISSLHLAVTNSVPDGEINPSSGSGTADLVQMLSKFGNGNRNGNGSRRGGIGNSNKRGSNPLKGVRTTSRFSQARWQGLWQKGR